tara:strand:+ start:219 stop:491 length:273 start_codon:yes stop_codon:yes gene_type:complete
MPIHEDIQNISDHSLYKTVAPIATAIMLASISWIFTMVLDLENKSLRNEHAIVVIQGDSEDVWNDIEKLQNEVTNIRIYIGNGHRNPHNQ